MVVETAAVELDGDLSEYGTQDGVVKSADGLRVTSPPAMWLAATDLLLQRLQSSGVDFGRIRAVSGAGQQHGSIYWRHGAAAKLAALQPDKTLLEQLKVWVWWLGSSAC